MQVRLRLSAGGAATAMSDGKALIPDHLPFGSSLVQLLWLVKCDDIYQRFTWVSLTASPWLLPAWSLLAQVQIRIRSCRAISTRGFVVLAASDRFVANAACASRELMAVHQVTSPPCDCHSYLRNFVSHFPNIPNHIFAAIRAITSR